MVWDQVQVPEPDFLLESRTLKAIQATRMLSAVCEEPVFLDTPQALKVAPSAVPSIQRPPEPDIPLQSDEPGMTWNILAVTLLMGGALAGLAGMTLL